MAEQMVTCPKCQARGLVPNSVEGSMATHD